MEYAIVADIHGHDINLEKALSIAEEQGVDSFVCLGDVIGKSGSSLNCLDMLFDRDAVLIEGNHDRLCKANLPPRYQDEFNSRLKRQYREGDLLFAHTATCREAFYGIEPWNDDRIDSEEKAANQFSGEDFSVFFYGHTHQAIVFQLDGSGNLFSRAIESSSKIVVEPNLRYMCNPGSITVLKDIDIENPHRAGQVLVTPSFAIYNSNNREVCFRFL